MVAGNNAENVVMSYDEMWGVSYFVIWATETNRPGFRLSYHHFPLRLFVEEWEALRCLYTEATHYECIRLKPHSVDTTESMRSKEQAHHHHHHHHLHPLRHSEHHHHAIIKSRKGPYTCRTLKQWNITLFFRTGICGYSGLFFAEREEELAINKLQQRFEICGCGIPIRRDHKIRTDRPLHGVSPPVTLPAVRSYAVVVHYNSWSYIYIDI